MTLKTLASLSYNNKIIAIIIIIIIIGHVHNLLPFSWNILVVLALTSTQSVLVPRPLLSCLVEDLCLHLHGPDLIEPT